MTAKKCCCCGLLSCFPCFSDKKSTLSAQPDSSEIANPPPTVITNPSPAATLSSAPSHQLSSSAPPSAAAPCQVNASIVMQNDSQPTAPSDAVPSSSRGIVTPSALIPTTSQTTASPPTQPASSSIPSSSRLPKESDYAQTTASPPTQPPSSSIASSSRLSKESDHAETIMEAAKELDKENVDVDFSGLINYISRLFDFIEEKTKEKNPSMPKAAVGSCVASENFLRLKDVVSEGVNAVAEMGLCQFDVINQIDMRLRKGQELKYPEYPKDAVGIEDPLKKVIERLEMGSDKKVVAVVVHGFGGMGKTTLADAVFERLFDANREGYKYSYVRLFDTIASVPDLVKLQRCILTDLMMGEESEIPEIRRYEEGQQVIEDMLEKEAAFIYINNVLLPDKVEQGRDALHHLLPKNMRNARKLRLLLTTRDKDAVRIRGVKPVFYPIEGLPHEEALDLFKKTLDGDSLQQLDTDQLNHLVKICEGVPKLMMVVAGFISSEENVQEAYSAVLEERKNNWKGEIGNDMECYIFAYENLEETLKEIFLDICVFFQGWYWETLSNIVGEAELKMLEKRALVTKDVKSMTVRVHDVMLAIGLDKKGERFRFTRASDFEKFLKKDNDQLQKIKGIWSSDDSNLLYVPASKLDSMHRSLRVVILAKSTKVAGKCTEIFKELVIFRARDSDLPFDKSKLEEFKKLRHLICKSEDSENLSEEKEKEKEQKKGNSPAKPKATRNYWPGSKFFFKLKDVLAEGIGGIKDVPTGDASKIARDLVKHVGMAHLVTTGFLVVANILERFEAISTNKGACLSLLKEMDKLARHVNELRKRPELKESMVDSIREAIALIVEASLACCTQINATKFSKFFSTTVNGEELAKFKTRLAETDTHMQRNFNLCLYDAIVRGRKPMELQYPEHPKDAVGIEKQLEKVIEMLEMGSHKNAVAVIVHGFGGMGKTTLADAVFARLLNAEIEGYKYSYVRLFDDITSTPNIVEKQKFIIKALEMGEEPKEFTRYEEGQRQIESILAKEVVLIYIDSVFLEQNRCALEELLPKNMGNARKLRLLFTARDKDAVRIRGVKPLVYPIEGLPHEESVELFKKTLDGDSQQQLHPDQLKQLVKICEGIPKLMMVVAGFINDELESKQKAYEGVMEESQKHWTGEIGNEIKRYVFAYDKLDDELKDPFLDICSFFQGWDWKELSDIVGDSELRRLETRALVTRDVKSMTARVHDVVLEVGLQRTEGNRFRLTTATEIEEFSDIKDEDLPKIKGIWANKDELRIPASKLDLMSGSLRVLKLGPLTDVQGRCKNTFKELVFFSATTSHLPFDLSKLKVGFKNLRHLCYQPKDLQNLLQMPSSLRHIEFQLNSPLFKISSQCIRQLKSSKLRVLRLEFAQFESLPQELGDLGNSLEELSFSGCENLKELPASISSLDNLIVLRMDGCSGLTKLGSLNNRLQELSLEGCKSLKELPSEVENLTSLQKLDLSWCESLEKLPRSLGNLTSLQELRLYSCRSLEGLPPSFEELSSLRILDLSHCYRIKGLPCGLEKLKSLVELDLYCCGLSSIPGSIGQLKLNSINLNSAPLECLPDGFCKFSTLRELDMTNCHRLQELPELFGNVTSLRKLSLICCRSLKRLPESFSQLNNLEHLDLSMCSTLEELCKDFKGLSGLRVLSLEGCDNLKKLPVGFHCLASLEVLDLRNCCRLEGKWIDSTVRMKALKILRIAGSKLLEKRWHTCQAQQYNQLWSCAVQTEQGLSNEENLLKQFQSKFESMLTNGKGEPLNISGLPPDTLLLVMFDGHQDFDLDFAFPFPLLEKNIGDIQTNFEMVYFGNHWGHLPQKVANRILGHAPANRDAEALFRSLLSLVVPRTDFDWQVTSSFQMSAKIVRGEKGDKHLSCWEFFEEDWDVENFVMTNCIRYLKLKELTERAEESNIELLRNLLAKEKENSLSFLKKGAATQVGVDELKGKTILLDIRPDNICFDITLQSLVEMYDAEKEKRRFDFEIITIQIMQETLNVDVSLEFSREVPWLVLQNPWELTHATKYFLVEEVASSQGWDRWYPNIIVIIDSNGRIAKPTDPRVTVIREDSNGRIVEPHNPGVLRMVNTWGAESYPFTEEKRRELIQNEARAMKVMSNSMFLFSHLESVSQQAIEATRQQKMTCLYSCHQREHTDSIKEALIELSNIICIIYIPNFRVTDPKVPGYLTDTIYEWYPTLEDSQMSQVEMQRMHCLSLSQQESIRFWARIYSLYEAKDEIADERLSKMLSTMTNGSENHSWMFIMDENGYLITEGKEFLKQLCPNDEAKAKELMQPLIIGVNESWERTLFDDEDSLFDDGDSEGDFSDEDASFNSGTPSEDYVSDEDASLHSGTPTSENDNLIVSSP